ncbi:hypothetical protein P154DRAFT_568592 [Amniculicola lignicola CBS 123094]|uniref:Uncharacterized protein n=1 Tax=Amniculicola lignicola CBS 123094 TaxID=1392246 RepID=A0A6A5X4H5_9PLEO|nr:hypothetical protein P154DRAFT_568592 [Amniculicola lignicola CBS 123094]
MHVAPVQDSDISSCFLPARALQRRGRMYSSIGRTKPSFGDRIQHEACAARIVSPLLSPKVRSAVLSRIGSGQPKVNVKCCDGSTLLESRAPRCHVFVVVATDVQVAKSSAPKQMPPRNEGRGSRLGAINCKSTSYARRRKEVLTFARGKMALPDVLCALCSGLRWAIVRFGRRQRRCCRRGLPTYGCHGCHGRRHSRRSTISSLHSGAGAHRSWWRAGALGAAAAFFVTVPILSEAWGPGLRLDVYGAMTRRLCNPSCVDDQPDPQDQTPEYFAGCLIGRTSRETF